MRFAKNATLAAAALAALSTTALAQSAATATTDLNIRSGPGPEYPIVGYIPGEDEVTVNGCLQGSKWCTVTHEGTQGWAYSDYLTAPISGSPVVMTDHYADAGVPVTTYEPSGAETGGTAGGATGMVGGAVAGALIGGPVGAAAGAAIGGAAGTVGGSAAGAIIDPPETVTTYVQTNPVQPVYLDGEVVVGAGVPETVTLTPIPDYDYEYAYVNGQPVLVEPGSHRIVYVVR
ncbi:MULTISPECIES: DUF1236 domain-containing protein [Afifella]|uniref:SH3 domain-containing protein n=1 Tax=Afifella marina DSM 2698 TaxID=1120955 RepID=A0A1G5NWS2_AFIMA|nr:MULTISPECIES: DUF1236 domain-containing protein [Afifella]MBK1624441.1 hypothetical protein [Afifella marina DSM 2698]MBK1628173.1 hypothetical protein [Afifella marina]MBK5916607.1 hypothetical protein [Afifella marina]RAI18963.1 hypothetical protein CH311_14035 [Afifella marina DSM 2698]SCZ41797.1 SH3 domain-containing protein [Afifella marina DSM 2698]